MALTFFRADANSASHRCSGFTHAASALHPAQHQPGRRSLALCATYTPRANSPVARLARLTRPPPRRLSRCAALPYRSPSRPVVKAASTPTSHNPTPTLPHLANVCTPTCPALWPWLSRLSLSTLFPEKYLSVSSATIPSFRSSRPHLRR